MPAKRLDAHSIPNHNRCTPNGCFAEGERGSPVRPVRLFSDRSCTHAAVCLFTSVFVHRESDYLFIFLRTRPKSKLKYVDCELFTNLITLSTPVLYKMLAI